MGRPLHLDGRDHPGVENVLYPGRQLGHLQAEGFVLGTAVEPHICCHKEIVGGYQPVTIRQFGTREVCLVSVLRSEEFDNLGWDGWMDGMLSGLVGGLLGWVVGG